MTTESARGTAPARNGRVECTLHTDPRLISAVGVIVTNAAQRAGLPEGTQQEIAAAALETCRRMFLPSVGQESNSNVMNLVVTDFANRVEVVIDAIEKASPAIDAEGKCKILEDLRSERVRYDTRDGRLRLTLLKSCSEAQPSQKI